tara:strand:- start:7648 stop:7959 length:312 start_codon:yes stop_codon:yes gene_type:complete
MAHNNLTWLTATYTVQISDAVRFPVIVSGRDRWALEQLIKAGTKGCTPIDNPAPRWSAYIFNLRALGVPILTHTEQHEGPFAGNHARYELNASVACLWQGVDA